MHIHLWWVRRDLRLEDNPALLRALQGASSVVPIFILDPHLLQREAPARQGFLFAALRSLDARLRQRGSRLVVRRGEPRAELLRLAAETQAERIVAEADISPYARRRDRRVAAEAPLELIHALTVHPPDAVRKPDGSPYTVFTPFNKAWKGLPFSVQQQPAGLPDYLPGVPEMLESAALPEGDAPRGFPADEEEAARRLAGFAADGIYRYADERNRMDLDGTSAISPYLRFGLLSARMAVAAAYRAMHSAADAAQRRGAETWLNELIWREFYVSILYHFPHVLKGAFNTRLNAIAWRESPADLQAWKDGVTGYPVVDAAQRQLAATGWMHNRARMISASFLTKDLLLNWQEGERWFLRHLVDGDPAANNGGWQWVAGTGTDAAPYFRIFNPVLQGIKFDPLGDYIRRWVPELAGLPAEWIHRPWEMTAALQQRYGVRIGITYPAPIVDHAAARERTLAAYRQAQG